MDPTVFLNHTNHSISSRGVSQKPRSPNKIIRKLKKLAFYIREFWFLHLEKIQNEQISNFLMLNQCERIYWVIIRNKNLLSKTSFPRWRKLLCPLTELLYSSFFIHLRWVKEQVEGGNTKSWYEFLIEHFNNSLLTLKRPCNPTEWINIIYILPHEFYSCLLISFNILILDSDDQEERALKMLVLKAYVNND